MRFNEQETLNFIHLYQQHECLWNPNHPGYRVKACREDAYCSMLSEMDKSGLFIKLLKQKIRSLRNSYLQKFVGPEPTHSTKLKWFEAMDKIFKTGNQFQVTPKQLWVQLNQHELGNAEEYGSECLFMNGSLPHTIIEDVGNSGNPPPHFEPPQKKPRKQSRPRRYSHYLPLASTADQHGMDHTTFKNGIDAVQAIQAGSNAPSNHEPHQESLEMVNSERRKETGPKCSTDCQPSAMSAGQYREFSHYIVTQMKGLPMRNVIILQEKILSLVWAERLACLDNSLNNSISTNF